jgi:hypothetical protein
MKTTSSATERTRVRSFDSHLAREALWQSLCRLCVPLMDNGIDNASGKNPAFPSVPGTGVVRRVALGRFA